MRCYRGDGASGVLTGRDASGRANATSEPKSRRRPPTLGVRTRVRQDQARQSTSAIRSRSRWRSRRGRVRAQREASSRTASSSDESCHRFDGSYCGVGGHPEHWRSRELARIQAASMGRIGPSASREAGQAESDGAAVRDQESALTAIAGDVVILHLDRDWIVSEGPGSD
jgi:hypothetical protein